ncbi:uncharacterized protein LOC117126658 isoform X1 [Brassica rapa]|uniref:uncharacterized protein LOC117126658 isoform X1 n=1 Tax=Brassica campestris TaxID=3711 RepID=UPI00142E0A66|nr:uncharacterized protein LOC117126658 isoform X1 [Brassica rapa]
MGVLQPRVSKVKAPDFFFYFLFSFFFCFLIFSVIRRNPPPLLSASPSETIDDSVGHHGVSSVFSIRRALETHRNDSMIWMLITARRGQHDLDADYRHKRTALPPNSLFNSSILDNFSPRLELLVSDAVKRQMTKDDEKHQKEGELLVLLTNGRKLMGTLCSF